MNQLNIKLLAVACFLFAFAPVASARQGAPDMSGMKNVARARQAQAFKDMYGFSDAQSKKYFAKEDQLNKDKEAQMTTLREKFTATKDKEQKRIIVRQLATLQANSGKKMRDAMLSVATAAQRQRIQTNQ